MTRALRLTVVAILALAMPGGAPSAQVAPPTGGGIVNPQQTAQPRAIPAPALPGLAARATPAPIPAEPGQNLAPNAALFDAVSRGDLVAARDAVGRGANVQARNALGLTALDAAVDQGRNDIAFYLLSARDASRAPPPEAAPARLPATPPAANRAPPRPATPLNAPPAAVAQPRGAALWAGNGGAAQPDIGFLGFDAGRPAGATPPPDTAPARRPDRG